MIIPTKKIVPQKYFLGKLRNIMNLLIHGESDFELPDVGDLSKYAYEDLRKYVLSLNKGFEIRKKVIVSDKFIAVFESKKTRFEILYHIDGSFIWKLHDEWLN